MAEPKEIRLIGFTLTKAKVEKNPNFKGQIKIKSDMKINSIEKDKLDLVKQETIKVGFDFEVDYNDMGKVEISGILGLILDAKSQKEILSQWKSKKIQPELQIPILNTILQKCSVKALELENEFGLPFHMQMPRLTPANTQQEKHSK